MKTITFTQEDLLGKTKLEQGPEQAMRITWPASGGGILLKNLLETKKRYLVFYVTAETDHSVPMLINVYSKYSKQEAPVFDIRYGIMPRFRTLICIDLDWLDGQVLFPETNEGQLKVVCHGRRVYQEEIDKAVFTIYDSVDETTLLIEEMRLTDKAPQHYPIPEEKIIDCFGQHKRKDWDGKVKNEADLEARLKKLADDKMAGFAIGDWNQYGGWLKKKLGDGTGFFTTCKQDGKWWLVDPAGFAFFSVGPDCTILRADCRVDGLEPLLEWLPDENDPVYRDFFQNNPWPYHKKPRRTCQLFSFEKANLHRVFADGWYEKWQGIVKNSFNRYGLNTVGNWSDPDLGRQISHPYVTMLRQFPKTETTIFRDFPDVMSDEYEKDADICAQQLADAKEDPWLIGYFMRNEPAWAFVDNLIIADEVLHNPNPSVSKTALINELKQQYGSVETLNQAWQTDFAGFDDLEQPIKQASAYSHQAADDLRAFSRKMLDRYVRVPAEACRKADPNHLNLGMRWAWISDPDLVTGWDCFDVFSINCYAVDPTSAVERVGELGVDLPVLIGEYHFGALDGALSATGLEGVVSQAERGVAYQYYCERVAAHPAGVGCHYFQFYDQFELGRFDGENYNIGLFDLCSLPYQPMMDAAAATSSRVYEIADGSKAPTERKPKMRPMIAY